MARIGETTVYLAEFQEYLGATLGVGEDEDPAELGTPEELNEVRSRLFDNFIEERLLSYNFV